MLIALLFAGFAAFPFARSHQDCPCYRSTTTVVDPECTPFLDLCPAVICDIPTATETVTIPPFTPICDSKHVPTITAFSPCTTDCAQVTCPTVFKTVTGGEKQCCTAW